MKRNLNLLIAKRFFWNTKALSTRSSLFALGGLTLGIAVLYVALAVMSGFESTLQKSLTDVAGHLTVVKRTSDLEPWKELLDTIKKADPRVVAGTPFARVEAVVAASGHVQGVILQGLDSESYQDVLNMQSRLVQGEFNLASKDKPVALVGKVLAQKMGKTIGDTINVVVPRFGDLESAGFRRTLGSFVIGGLLDLGKFEWNERLIVADMKQVQKLAEIKDRYSGLLLKTENANLAGDVASDLVGKLGSPFWIRDWRSEHENIFMAIQLERPVIFFVVYILVIVAAFAVSSNMLLQTLQKASDMAVLKSMGLTSRRILLIYFSQGLFIGFCGTVLGVVSGWFFTVLINLYQKRWGLISGEVYKIDHIDFSVRGLDLVWIFASTLVVCGLAALIPSIRASRRQAAEGLRYE